MAEKVTDAEFVVVQEPRRLGEPHPGDTRWRYAGIDANGRMRWRRRGPSRTVLFLVLCVAVVAIRFLAALSDLMIHHGRPY